MFLRAYKLLLFAVAMISSTSAAAQSPELLSLIGGSGGNSFSRTCPAKHVLAGFRWRTGLVLDGIGIKCRPIQSDGRLGAAVDVGAMAGGNGGTAGSASCPSNSVVVSQSGSSQAGVGIGILLVGCFEWFPASRTWGGSRLTHLAIKTGGSVPAFETQQCRYGSQPAVGIRGRHGSFVDAFGLRCDDP